jgi:hypothetical protein
MARLKAYIISKLYINLIFKFMDDTKLELLKDTPETATDMGYVSILLDSIPMIMTGSLEVIMMSINLHYT